MVVKFEKVMVENTLTTLKGSSGINKHLLCLANSFAIVTKSRFQSS